MIFWGLALGVSFVSIYDRKGVIVRNKSVLKKTVEAKAIQYVGVAKRACCSIDFHTLSDSDPAGQGRKNGEKVGERERKTETDTRTHTPTKARTGTKTHISKRT